MGGRFVSRMVPVALLALAGCASVGGDPGAGGGRGEPPLASASGPVVGGGSGVGEPPLVGTAWQLASYRESAAGTPVAVTTDSTLTFSARSRFSAHACNYLGGPARVEGHTITFGRWSTTQKGCIGEEAALESAVRATVTGSATWSIRGQTLTLSNRDGHVLTYRVRPSEYPSLTARTITTGTRAGGEFRLAVDDAADRLSLLVETRTAPGESWGTGGVISPGSKDCLANHVLPAGHLGKETFLVAWATTDVAKVTTRATAGAPERPLTFYAVPGSTLRIAGLWTTDFRPSESPVIFYDRNGKVIAAYPNGPC